MSTNTCEVCGTADTQCRIVSTAFNGDLWMCGDCEGQYLHDTGQQATNKRPGRKPKYGHAMTPAQRKAAERERMKAKGCTLKQIWVDKSQYDMGYYEAQRKDRQPPFKPFSDFDPVEYRSYLIGYADGCADQKEAQEAG